MKKKEEKSLQEIEKKEGFGTKFVNVLKKKWLISGTMTLLLVAILVAAFILINIGMQKLDLTPLDFTSEKVYTLSDTSKEKVADIDQDVNLYFIGYSDDDSAMILAKQYNKTNEHINVEAVDIEQRTDLAQKYEITDSDSTGIIVECGDRSKVLSSDDLYTYDYSTYETIDITEEKLTSSILTVTTDDIPNVYFLNGYSEFSLTENMNYLSMYMENEIMEINTVDILSEGKVPDDCDTLIITTPSKDFEDVVANSIIDYINKGGNILWFNGAYGTEVSLPNVNKVLATYGVDAFEVGYIMETDSSKMISGAEYMIKPDVESSEVTDDIASGDGVLFLQATKINIQDEEILESLKVEEEDLLTASSTSFFRSDISNTTTSKASSDEDGEFVVGTMLTKTIKEAETETDEETGEETETTPATTSSLIIYGENYFISDFTISSSSQTAIILVYDNKDLALNSIAHLTERDEDITIRKTTDTVTYTATEQEDAIIKAIIFTVPCLIVLAGIIVWQYRRRKK